ncbi:MAG TPA: hypothetical protein VEP72_05955 [Microbacterium sp.]|nr:hypothetical protein [Microbacterium sp.]
MTETIPAPRRRWFTLAAVVAAVVAVVFSTVGDGVEVPDATGVRRVIVDLGHQAVWALLAGAFAAAAARGRWGRPSQVLAVAAGILYLVFLSAVFLWP